VITLSIHCWIFTLLFLKFSFFISSNLRELGLFLSCTHLSPWFFSGHESLSSGCYCSSLVDCLLVNLRQTMLFLGFWFLHLSLLSCSLLFLLCHLCFHLSLCLGLSLGIQINLHICLGCSGLSGLLCRQLLGLISCATSSCLLLLLLINLFGLCC